MTKGKISVHTDNLLPIIKKWLYSDSDIFIRELVSNAQDAIMKHKKLVSIGEATAESKYEIHVCVKKEDNIITISDNGEGIEKSELKNIFKRFYKGKNSINPKSIGIGLSLSKKIIEAHGGSITAESELGKGTNFNIILLKVIV